MQALSQVTSTELELKKVLVETLAMMPSSILVWEVLEMVMILMLLPSPPLTNQGSPFLHQSSPKKESSTLSTLMAKAPVTMMMVIMILILLLLMLLLLRRLMLPSKPSKPSKPPKRMQPSRPCPSAPVRPRLRLMILSPSLWPSPPETSSGIHWAASHPKPPLHSTMPDERPTARHGSSEDGSMTNLLVVVLQPPSTICSLQCNQGHYT